MNVSKNEFTTPNNKLLVRSAKHLYKLFKSLPKFFKYQRHIGTITLQLLPTLIFAFFFRNFYKNFVV